MFWVALGFLAYKLKALVFPAPTFEAEAQRGVPEGAAKAAAARQPQAPGRIEFRSGFPCPEIRKAAGFPAQILKAAAHRAVPAGAAQAAPAPQAQALQK